ncbi:MAG TPA: DnaA/Hda family protein, partial [Planctomycetota bacterium]|nr:DnaA/Hda family protein [Planctomycetota bacterium]
KVEQTQEQIQQEDKVEQIQEQIQQEDKVEQTQEQIQQEDKVEQIQEQIKQEQIKQAQIQIQRAQEQIEQAQRQIQQAQIQIQQAQMQVQNTEATPILRLVSDDSMFHDKVHDQDEDEDNNEDEDNDNRRYKYRIEDDEDFQKNKDYYYSPEFLEELRRESGYYYDKDEEDEEFNISDEEFNEAEMQETEVDLAEEYLSSLRRELGYNDNEVPRILPETEPEKPERWYDDKDAPYPPEDVVMPKKRKRGRPRKNVNTTEAYIAKGQEHLERVNEWHRKQQHKDGKIQPTIDVWTGEEEGYHSIEEFEKDNQRKNDYIRQKLANNEDPFETSELKEHLERRNAAILRNQKAMEKKLLDAEAKERKKLGDVKYLEKKRREKLAAVRSEWELLFFENFLVEEGNELAFQIMSSLPKQEETEFTPIVLFGKEGSGKRHLVNATIHNLKYYQPDAKVVHTNGEEFYRKFVNAIRHKKTFTFRKDMRNCDFFIMEDIEALEKKIKTQVELRYMFHEMFCRGCQVILTAEKPIKQLNFIDDFIGHIMGGLHIHVKPLTFERVWEYSKRMADQKGVPVAKKCVREVWNQFDCFTLYQKIYGQIIDILQRNGKGLSPFTLSQFKISPYRIVKPKTFDDIVELVCSYYKVSPNILTYPDKSRRCCKPKYIIIALAKNILDLTNEELRKQFKFSSESSVRYALKKVKEMPELYYIYDEAYRKLTEKIVEENYKK